MQLSDSALLEMFDEGHGSECLLSHLSREQKLACQKFALQMVDSRFELSTEVFDSAAEAVASLPGVNNIAIVAIALDHVIRAFQEPYTRHVQTLAESN